MHQLEKLKRLEAAAIGLSALILLAALFKKSIFLGHLSLWVLVASMAIEGNLYFQTGNKLEAIKHWGRCAILLLLSILFLSQRI